jgi:7-cyano-7-deazaguanine synthase
MIANRNEAEPDQRAVVAMSGGQDSTTCLAWALEKYGAGNVHAITFDYKQRHRVELDAARGICASWSVPQVTLSVPAFAELGAAALTSDRIDVSADATGTGNAHAERRGLPSTFVPGRNLIFLGLVGAYAAQHAIGNVVTGICWADEAGYPDCRPEFRDRFEDALNAAMGLPDESKIRVEAPLLFLDKAATWALADTLGVLETIIERTHTCYRGERDALHPWGYGCGTCPACVERANGFDTFTSKREGVTA